MKSVQIKNVLKHRIPIIQTARKTTVATMSLTSALESLQSMYTQELGPRLKAIEDASDAPPVPASKPFVIRADGVAFSTFTRGLVKPFDYRLKDAMVATTVDLMARFQPLCAYHHSDEISLIYPAAMPDPLDNYDENGVLIPVMDVDSTDSTPLSDTTNKNKKQKHVEKTHMYSGRVQKLASVVASYASARLNYHLSLYDWSDRPDHVAARMKGHEAYFDGRVVPLPNMASAMDCIFWRSNFDGFRNSVSGIAQFHFSHSELQGKNLRQLLEMLKTKNVDVMETYGPKYLFGTWIKKELYTVSKDELEPEIAKRLADGAVVVRKRFRTGSFNWADFSAQDRVRFVAAKTWPTYAVAPPKDDLKESK
ncbi:hypothetical protein HDU81_009200 [Chytriomyces hyalinus]|nr:hypothetical protein HDU81_009200 [Chytriomyces hyalinus]